MEEAQASQIEDTRSKRSLFGTVFKLAAFAVVATVVWNLLEGWGWAWWLEIPAIGMIAALFYSHEARVGAMEGIAEGLEDAANRETGETNYAREARIRNANREYGDDRFDSNIPPVYRERANGLWEGSLKNQ